MLINCISHFIILIQFLIFFINFILNTIIIDKVYKTKTYKTTIQIAAERENKEILNFYLIMME